MTGGINLTSCINGGGALFFKVEDFLETNERHEEIKKALGTTIEREVVGGLLWCPTATATKLQRYLTTYAKELDGLSQQAVRFMVAMECSDAQGLIGFLYGRIRRLTPPEFKSALNQISLESTGSFDGETLHLTDRRLLSSTGQSFDIAVTQMPLIGAFIDVCHNMLGFNKVQELVAPLHDVESLPAADVAKAFRAALVDWLRPGLQKEHYLKQARSIGLYLQAREVNHPSAIDSEIIFSLWEAETGQTNDLLSRSEYKPGTVDGFKTYENAACLMIVYRSALQLAIDEAGADDTALSLDEISDTTGPSRDIAVFDRDEATNFVLEHSLRIADNEHEWFSPFQALQEAPANLVKWFDGKQTRFLSRFINANAQDSALFGNEHPDLTLAPTISRYGVFGPFQRSWRTSAAVGDAADLPSVNYSDDLEQWQALVDTLLTARLAAAYDLCRRANIQGLLLFGEIDSKGTQDLFNVSELDLASPDQVMTAFANRMDSVEHPLLRQARQAYTQCNRAGFRKQDRSSPEMEQALEAGAPYVSALIQLLEQTIQGIDRSNVVSLFESDGKRFVSGYKRLYGQGENAPTV